MKQWSMIFLCILLCVLPASVNAGDYALGPGDTLAVNVFGIPDLNVTEATVRPDGKITMPPVGEIMVTGMTVAELSSQLTEKLGRYYEEPIVTVTVKNFRTTRIYVVGQVAKPGAYELDKRHNLMDAIGAAQGWTQDALKTKVYIIRNGSRENPTKVNLLDLLQKGDTSKNYVLNDGDIVYLSDNGRFDFSRDIVPLVNPIWLIRNWISPHTG